VGSGRGRLTSKNTLIDNHPEPFIIRKLNPGVLLVYPANADRLGRRCTAPNNFAKETHNKSKNSISKEERER